LDDLFKSIYDDLVVNLKWKQPMASWSCMSKVDFWIKYAYLDQIRWNMNVGYIIDLKMDVMWILSKLVNYGKFHEWPTEIAWINYISMWVYGNILNDYGKKNIKRCVRLIMEDI